MDIEALKQLIASGNTKTIEETWLTALADEDTPLDAWVRRMDLLDALVKSDNAGEAGALAWAAVETLRERHEDAELIPLAAAILRLGNASDDVRGLAIDLYKAAYADRPNIELLIDEAGLAGGKTPRRALRTLDVCLHLTPESFLVGRHDDSAARVDEIDSSTWHATITTSRGSDTLDPTTLADKYAPVDADDFRVLSQFDPGRLTQVLEKDPVPVIRGIVRQHGDRMTADALEVFLAGRFIDAGQWPKWWTRARSKLKRAADMRIEGRNPYVVVYDPEADTLEDETRGQFDRTHDSAASLKVLQTYLRECRSRKADPAPDLLRHIAENLQARADRQQKIGNKLALETLLVTARVRQALGEEDADAGAVALLAAAENPSMLIQAIEVTELWSDACGCVEKAYPSNATEQLAELLPVAPTSACDSIASRLLDLGYSLEDMDELVQEVIAEPVLHYGMLFWLWTGPTRKEVVRSVKPITLLHRILSMLAEMKRNDRIDPDVTRAIRAGARTALSNRKYAQFLHCLDGMESGSGTILYTQVRRLEELGRAVQEDLLKLIGHQFPDIFARPKVLPWKDENVLYVTAKGLARKEAEVHELVNVKMKENAKAIGAAAEHGDLSENSEYKFALEERDLLRARLAQMNSQLEIAQVLEPDEVPMDRVGIGSRVSMRHVESGQQRDITILSAWEANIEQNVVNYKAPMAQEILGSRPGDTVELQLTDAPGKYTIQSLANALLE